MVDAWRISEIERIVEEAVQEGIEESRDDEYGWHAEAEAQTEKIREALSELDEMSADSWRYHLDNHTGPIAYCTHRACTEDTRAGLVASILRGE